MRDLVALSTLPAIWAGTDVRRIPASLADVLLRTLGVDLAYVEVNDGPEAAQELRVSDAISAPREAILAAIRARLQVEAAPTELADPVTGRRFHCAVSRFGMGDVSGLLIAASRTPEFPTESERVLLGVTANHAFTELSRRRTEKRLQVKTERFELLSSNVKEYALVITDAEGIIREWSAGAERVTRYVEAEALGAPVDILFTPAERAAGEPAAERERALRDGKSVDARWHQRKGGERFHAEGVTTALRDASGALRGFAKIFRDATEQYETQCAQERLLREVQAERTRLAEVFDLSPSFMAVLAGPDHVFERANRKYMELVGGREVLGKPIDEALPEAAPQGFTKLLDRVLRTGEPYIGTDVAVQLRRPDGRSETVYVDFVYQPMRGGEGEITGVFVQGIDLTERKRSQAALAQVTADSERRRRLYETILSNTPDLVYVFDLEHRFTYANDTLLRIWGRTSDEAIGRKLLELGYEAWHAEMHAREIEQVKVTRRSIRGEVPFTGTNGRRIYDYIFVPVIGPSGEVEAIAGTTRDITDLKRAQEKLEALLDRETRRADLLGRVAEAGRKLHSVLDVEAIADVLTQEARNIIGAHMGLTSLTVSEDWAQSINAVSLSEKYARYRDYDAQPDGSGIYSLVCRTNTPMRMTQQELEAHPAWREFGSHAGRHPPLRGWLAVPLVGHGGRNLGVVQLSDKYADHFTQEDEAVLVQLAAIASAGIENARLYNELRVQARRKDEFLATLAHELRNPLAPVRNGLFLLERSTSGEVSARVREMMSRQVAHMVRLIDDLLDVSRITTGKVQLRPETVELRRVLDAAVEVSRPLIERAHHELSISISEDPQLRVRVDPTRIAQVVSNLLNNAAKYTPEGGRIELSAGLERGQVTIRVRDNGAGLANETIPEIFELFTQVGKTLDRAQGGLGIGLALVKRLVEMHGGQVQAESAGVGKGSTFTVRLPLAPAATEESRQAEPRRTRSGTRSSRILVVDDNEDAAQTLAAVLAMSGHTTKICHSGLAALKEAGTFAPEVVLLDIGLPEMDGYEVARRLRSSPGGMQLVLVAVTGWGSENDRKRTREAGFDEHLTKPIEFERLEAVLARLSPLRPRSPGSAKHDQ
jgi:PAS domain S-box-containing protein